MKRRALTCAFCFWSYPGFARAALAEGRLAWLTQDLRLLQQTMPN